MKYRQLKARQKELKQGIRDINLEIDKRAEGKGNPHLNFYAEQGARSRRFAKYRELMDIESELKLIYFKWSLLFCVLLVASSALIGALK